MYGHVKGAFTDASRDQKGLIREKKIILLDELGDLSEYSQTKLLRVVEGQEYKEIGSPKTIKCDTVFIGATNKLEKVRTELLNRFYPIYLPALRQMRKDLPLFINLFLKKSQSDWSIEIESITHQALECFFDYPWYGNVRELQKSIEETVIKKIITPSNKNRCINYDDLPLSLQRAFNKKEKEIEIPLPELKEKFLELFSHRLPKNKDYNTMAEEALEFYRRKQREAKEDPVAKALKDINSRNRTMQLIKPQLDALQKSNEKNLTDLLNIKSEKEALKEFEKLWIVHQKKVLGRLDKECAKDTGITGSAYSQRKTKLGIKKK